MPKFKGYLQNNGKPTSRYNKFGDVVKVKNKDGDMEDQYYPDIVDAVELTNEYYVDVQGKQYPAKDINIEHIRKSKEEDNPLQYPTKEYIIRAGRDGKPGEIVEFDNKHHFDYFWDKYKFCDSVTEKGELVKKNKTRPPTGRDRQIADDNGKKYDKDYKLVDKEDDDFEAPEALDSKDSLIKQQQRDIEELKAKQVN